MMNLKSMGTGIMMCGLVGCLPHRAWTPQEKALGASEVVNTSTIPAEPKVDVTGSTDSTVALEVQTLEIPVEHLQQRFRVWEHGEYARTDASTAAYAWGLGGLFAGVVPAAVFGTTTTSSSGEEVFQGSGVAYLATVGLFALPTIYFAIAPSRNRGRKKEIRKTSRDLPPVPLSGAKVEIGIQERSSFGTWSSGDDGFVAVELDFTQVAAVA